MTAVSRPQDFATNRVNVSDFSYDATGNQTQITQNGGAVKKFQYDAANRLINVKDANNNLLASYTYSSSNERLIGEEYGQGTSVRTYYVGEAEPKLIYHPCLKAQEHFAYSNTFQDKGHLQS